MTPVDLSDPRDACEWLAQVESAADDAVAVAEDQLRPPGERALGRAQARQLLDEAKATIAGLLASARAAIPSAP